MVVILMYDFSGQLKIAEVVSRFHSLPQFLLKVEQFGFYQVSKVQLQFHGHQFLGQNEVHISRIRICILVDHYRYIVLCFSSFSGHVKQNVLHIHFQENRKTKSQSSHVNPWTLCVQKKIKCEIFQINNLFIQYMKFMSMQ